MPKLNNKRQITLSKEHCLLAHLSPGDEVECYLDLHGDIKIVKTLDDSDIKKNPTRTKSYGPSPDFI